MSTLVIRKKSLKTWLHTDSILGDFIISKFYFNADNVSFQIVEQGQSKRVIYNINDITLYAVPTGGTAETFTTITELSLRLEELNYTAFQYDGQITSIANLIDAGTNITITGEGTEASPYVISSGGSQNLGSVLTEGNTTDGENISISDGDAVILDNGSKLIKGTTDAGNGGNNGIALRCSIDYELKWEAGRLYVMEQDGFTIREVKYNFTDTPTVDDDNTKGFVIGSRWILDNDDVYSCTDDTTGAAVWDLIESGVPTLQQVLDNNHDLVDGNNFQGTDAGLDNTGTNINALGGFAGFTNAGINVNAFGINTANFNAGDDLNSLGENSAFENTGNNVNALGNNSANTNTGDNLNALGKQAGNFNSAKNVNAFGELSANNNIYKNVNLFGFESVADADNQTVFSKWISGSTKYLGRLSFANITANRKWELPDASGTIALTSDVPAPDLFKTTASGTDTYTATVSGVAAYDDGAAYLVRFTNGNTTGATLNINSIGAKTLYRNNDGELIGGDIQDGAEMLCIFNTALDGFQCIGTSPNSLFAYVSNADSVSLTKGMVVYAFGGTGDRMTVKRALNTSDATSAQTVGLVLSASISAGQKGLIIIQGILDGLSILPTSTFSDGDAIYLGDTAGSITNVKPYAPNHLVYLGVVTTASNGSAGRMYVRVQNGYEMQELHNVDALNPDNNDGLFYNSTSQLWEHKNVLAVAAERRNANNSSNNNINYCGIAPADSLESAAVWTITRLTISYAGAVTTATATSVEWDDRETATYT